MRRLGVRRADLHPTGEKWETSAGCTVVPGGMVWYGVVWYGIGMISVWYRYGIAYDTVWYGMVWYGMI